MRRAPSGATVVGRSTRRNTSTRCSRRQGAAESGGEEKHGRWLIAPVGEVRSVSRRYRQGTLILETDFQTAEGAARVIDFMPLRDGGAPQLMRIVQGLRGRVPMRMQLIIRFEYGSG